MGIVLAGSSECDVGAGQRVAVEEILRNVAANPQRGLPEALEIVHEARAGIGGRTVVSDERDRYRKPYWVIRTE